LKQPNEFIPERFLDENIKFSKNYFPFGGPRMYWYFAMYEMILAIIALVEQFEIIEKESLFK
jgi:cytochrome P450